MARLSWGAVGQRFFESGLDRGVLYSSSAVAWQGLVSVSESPSGGEAKPYYIDGVKYLNLATAEEFEATITAVHYPAEFAQHDGVGVVHNGLSVTNQPRKPFSLSYRTKVSSDVDVDYGYKIHLIYNALAAPASRTNNSLSDSASITPFSWQITTLPPPITNFRRTAHLVIDSRKTDPTKLATIENLLYGTVSTAPSLPTPDALIAIFNS